MRPTPSFAIKAILLAGLVLAPLSLDAGLLQTGCLTMAAMVAAMGLTVLVGAAGQLSLAHAFFIAVGAYSYSYYAGVDSPPAQGLGLPTLLALVLAVLTSGAFGLAFSPISGRLRGIYLGVASLSLVFIGEFAYDSFRAISGGFNGRAAPALNLLGLEFSNAHQPVLLGVPFGKLEKLWLLELALTIGAYVFARNVLRGRMGRAMQTVRDSEVAAAVMGVDVRRAKAGAFVLSSMYAGLGGVMLALAIGRVTSSNFGLALSIGYLAAVVIGGLGSVFGAVLGAFFVTAGPLLINRYSDTIPGIAQPGSFGYDGSVVASLAYGTATILVVMFEPGGLAAVGKRLSGLSGRGTSSSAASPGAAGPQVQSNVLVRMRTVLLDLDQRFVWNNWPRRSSAATSESTYLTKEIA
jgi:branched-chain amino acid transport system permease protein